MGIATVVGVALVATGFGFVIWFSENAWKLREVGYQLKLSAKQKELDAMKVMLASKQVEYDHIAAFYKVAMDDLSLLKDSRRRLLEELQGESCSPKNN